MIRPAKNLRKDPQLRYKLLFTFCVTASVTVVLVCAIQNHTKDGGLGGAAAVAASFCALMVREELGKRLLSLLSRSRRDLKGTESARLAALEQRMNALVASQEQMAKESHRQNVTIALGSVIGTIFWALGDKFAYGLRALFSSGH